MSLTEFSYVDGLHKATPDMRENMTEEKLE